MEPDEELKGALIRECEEELGVEVSVGQEYQSLQKEDSPNEIEHFFLCKITDGALGTGKGPEFSTNQYAGSHTVEWISEEKPESTKLIPVIIKERLVKEVSLDSLNQWA